MHKSTTAITYNTIMTHSRPLLKLLDKLILVGTMRDEDLVNLLVMIDPVTWDPENEKGVAAFQLMQ